MSSWADSVEAEEKGEAAPTTESTPEIGDELPGRYESEVDENGIKTVIEYAKDVRTAERVKVTRTVKVTKKDERIKKCVMERRTWPKFGAAVEAQQRDTKGKLPAKFMEQYSGIGFQQEGLTYFPTAQELDFTPKKKVVMKKKKVEETVKPVGVWRRTERTGPAAPGGAPGGTGGSSLAALAAGGGKSGAYVPPTMRAADGSRRMDLDSIRTQRDDTATLRVSNLSDDVREEDLAQLFRPFGPITRTYLAKDRNTGWSRGFAFINFVRKEDAAVAMEKLAGYGYDHLILQIEWAKPSAN